MATARKPFVRLETSLHREPWSRDEKMTLCELMMFLGDRWARDRLTADEACRAILTRHQLAAITGRSQLASARRSLRALSERVSISIEVQGEFTSIFWPKFAKTQELESRGRESQGPSKARRKPESAPAPSPAPAKPQESQPLRGSTGGDADSPQDPEPPKPAVKVQPKATDATLRLVATILKSMPGSDVPVSDPKRFEKWALTLDRLQRLDNDGKWTWGEINSVITWLPTHKRPDFSWGLVVRSASNFRKHFPRMIAEMKSAPGSKGPRMGWGEPEDESTQEVVF